MRWAAKIVLMRVDLPKPVWPVNSAIRQRLYTGQQHHPLTDHHDIELFRHISLTALWACKANRMTDREASLQEFVLYLLR